MTRFDPTREIRAPRGTTLNAKSWQTEAPLRMLMNNLDPEVAEHPQSLVVYGGIGRAAGVFGQCRGQMSHRHAQRRFGLPAFE